MSNALAKLELIVTHDILAEETNHKLIIQTSAGQYAGKLYTETDSEHRYISGIIQRFNDTRSSKKDEDEPFAISLVDVEFYGTNLVAPSKMPYVTLFLDQILGVTIGSYRRPEQ